MKNYIQRMLALVMALALCAGLFTVPAFGAEGDENMTDSEPVASAPVEEAKSDETTEENTPEAPRTKVVPAAATEEPKSGEASEENDSEATEPASAVTFLNVEDGNNSDNDGEDSDDEDTETNDDESVMDTLSDESNTGDFIVTGAEGDYSFDNENGVLTITGDVTVSTDGETNQRIVVNGNATVTLAGVTISAANGPAILIKAPYAATLTLAEGTINTVQGSYYDDWGYAGVDVEFVWEDIDVENPKNEKAYLTINGKGRLDAFGYAGAAAIGGSRVANEITRDRTLYGSITIDSGTINATSYAINAKGEHNTNRYSGAAIGSSNNKEAKTPSASYKSTGNNVWGPITINGGTVTAVSTTSGAGIGGGNHVDSKEIIINGGTIYAEGDSGIGCGRGSSKPSDDNGNEKGPGYYFANVTVNGGDITAYATNSMGAGIGGGMYSDAYVTITGGTVNASVKLNGKLYQGAAGIGGGYQGAAVVTITGGSITATGGNGSPGIGNGAGATDTTTSEYADGVWSGTKNVRTGIPTINGETSAVSISGGTVKSYGGYYGAGIGSGNFTKWSNVSITGGTVYAEGYLSAEEAMCGGAGIGSGMTHSPDKMAYKTETTEHISITGGNVIAVGGWGASGIGSGANNEMANTIEIKAKSETAPDGAEIQAYSDGTKFAIDTRGQGGNGFDAVSFSEGRTIRGSVLQGTFVFPYEDNIGVEQHTRGLSSIEVSTTQTNEVLGETKTLTLMPDGYRSFATNVPHDGSYTVYSNKVIQDGTLHTQGTGDGDSNGRYFNVCRTERYQEENVTARNVQYQVTSGATGDLCDNFFLFPVKTIVVTKKVEAESMEKDAVNTTVYFSLAQKNEDGSKGDFVKNETGSQWIIPVEIVNGVPTSKAIFANVDNGSYDVWEVNADGTSTSNGMIVDTMVLKMISTNHTYHNGDVIQDETGGKNNGQISDDQWSDYVTVINTYEPVPKDEPAPPSGGHSSRPKPDPEPQPDPDQKPAIDIVDENTPLSDLPTIPDEEPTVEILDEEPTVEIPDGDTPLAELPPSLMAEQEPVTIVEDPAPLATRSTPSAATASRTKASTVNSPRTGDNSHTALWAVMGVASALGMAVVAKRRVED